MSTTVHPTSVIEAGAALHDGVYVGPFCHVGANVELGAGTRLISHASVRGTTKLGSDCVLRPYAAIGGVPQVLGAEESPDSRLEIGDKCVFHENSTVHTGWPKTGGLTKVGVNCLVMVGAHIAHDCQIGSNVVMATNASLAGHVHVGDNVWFGGLAAVHQFSRIGRNALIGGGAIVVEDVIPFGSVIGNHAKLAGLNTVGLKRRGFSKADLHQIRAAYRAVFKGEGLFKDRLASAATAFEGQALAMELIDFIREGGDRPICKPG
ncbi:MAG: acyl-ACP--UDP-N-acetylglucosamine O-acyltransferase [Hyphomonas sp.]|uniref:acyl-ACP--UDP-N-acetylglucosamine O-acyltransferase n=1 Tax=Hyphomonas sp. TaxID=87 RepID=UPI0034A09A43